MREGFFRKDEFRYDAGRDAYVCPAGQLLTPIRRGRLRDLEKIDYGNPKPAAPVRCARDARTTSARSRAWRTRTCSTAWPRASRRGRRFSTVAARSSSIPFGTIKQWMNQGAFLMRGLDKVRAEFSLTALVYNLRRALNILGVEADDGRGGRVKGRALSARTGVLGA